MSLRASRSERSNLQMYAFAVAALNFITPLAPLVSRGERETKIASQSLAMTGSYFLFSYDSLSILRQETAQRAIPIPLERRHETQADGEFADQNRQWKTDDLVRELH